MARERLGQVIVAAGSLDHTGVDERAHDFFDEERISAGALYQETLEDLQIRIGTE